MQYLDSLLKLHGVNINNSVNGIIKNHAPKDINNLSLLAVEEPLHIIEIANQKLNSFRFETEKEFDNYFAQLFKDIGLKKFRPFYFENMLSSKEIDNQIKLNLDSALGFAESKLARQFISSLIQSKEIINKDILTSSNSLKKMLLEGYSNYLIFKETTDSLTFEINAEEFIAVNDEENKRKTDFLRAAQFSKNSEVYSLGLSIYKMMVQLSDQYGKNLELIQKEIKTSIIDTEYGRIAIGGAGDDEYIGEFALIIDVGGNDKYVLTSESKLPIRMLIDYSGNDIYFGNNNALAGALFGIDILIDLSGDDLYEAESNSIASAIFGIGILSDQSGNDIYRGKFHTQAASSYGIALLIDSKGNDKYYSFAQSQSYSGPMGFSILFEKTGDDEYRTTNPFENEKLQGRTYLSYSQAASMGFEGFVSGGIALLSDNYGDDKYISDSFSRGFAIGYGTSVFRDIVGNDKYYSYSWSNGAAMFGGQSLFWDYGGDDEYYSTALSCGSSYQKAISIFIEDSGLDKYQVEDSQFGSSFANSIAIFDKHGNNDRIGKTKYHTEIAFGDNFQALNIPRIGIKINREEPNQPLYNNLPILNVLPTNLHIWQSLTFEVKRKLSQDTMLFEFPNDIQKLINIAIYGNLLVDDYSEYAIAKLALIPTFAIPLIINYLGSDVEIERKIAERILVEIGKNDKPRILKLLSDSLNSVNNYTIESALNIASKLKIIEIWDIVKNLYSSKNPLIVENAILSSWIFNDSYNYRQLENFLISDDYRLSIASAFSLGRMFNDSSVSIVLKNRSLLSSLKRQAFIEGIYSADLLNYDLLFRLLNEFDDDFSLNCLPGLIFKSPQGKEDLRNLITEIIKQPRETRERLYSYFNGNPNEFWEGRINELYQKEKDLKLKELIDPSKFEKKPK